MGRTESVTSLAQQHQVSRKFLYQQAHKAEEALETAFADPPHDQRVLFYLPVTAAWIRMCVMALVLLCHSSYRGVIEFLRDILDVKMSIGTVHKIVNDTVPHAQAINQAQDLSNVRIGVHDELFQGRTPVLAGTDHDSGYCYLLSDEAHRDADTWGIHLLDLHEQGLSPEHTIADQANGLRAGQAIAMPGVACHGDCFHLFHKVEQMVSFFDRRATGCTSTREQVDRKMARAKQKGRGNTLSKKLALARAAEEKYLHLAQDVRVLADWLHGDILSLAGPDLTTRRELYDFVVEEFIVLEPLCPHRLRPVRRALQQQRDDLLAFAAVIDEKLAVISEQYGVSLHLVQALCELAGRPEDSRLRWHQEHRLRQRLTWKFFDVQHAVSEAIATTPRTSSVIENFNSRLRNYFFLRKHLSSSYLDLLRFFLNHRRFLHTTRPERRGKSPAELLTGHSHAHWLELLGFSPFRRHSATA
ncbi:MAG: hypothetical protein GY847_24580 [Proteobacteria bacterium]|nr:hypothetical protein [Pseudomonadota bacterium]